MTEQSERLASLTAWRTSWVERGQEAPPDLALVWIADAGHIPAALESALSQPCRAEIDAVLRSSGPHADKRAPEPQSGPAAAEQPVPARVRLLEALKAWRDAERSAGRPAGAFTDHELGRMSLSLLHEGSVQDPTRRMPEFARPFAAQILAVLKSAGGGAPAPAAVPAQPNPAESAKPNPAESAKPTAAASESTSVDKEPTPPAPPERGDPEVARAAAEAGPKASGAVPPTVEWAPYSGLPPDRLGTVHVRAAASGLELAWRRHETGQPYTAYRVVADDEMRPFAPEVARLVAATTGTSATDAEPFTRLLRHVQVWANAGADLEAAALAEPVPVAETVVVAPLADITVREDEGTVIAAWTAMPGVHRVAVYRRPTSAGRGDDDEQFAILTTDRNLNGFVDEEAQRGESYVYRAVVVAQTKDMVELRSSPVDVSVDVSAVLSAVDDLQAESEVAYPGGSVTLRWSRPKTGAVWIYRSAKEPLAGVDHVVHDVGSLSQMGFTEADRLGHPVDLATVPGVGLMQRVAWPPAWERMYFTPVTVLQGRVTAGRTITLAGAAPVRSPRIVERVNEQVLTFEWPQGAASVDVHRLHRDAQVTGGMQGPPLVSVSEQDYRRRGGVHLTLPADGCMLALTATLFNAGNKVAARPVTVDYSGLLRIRYSVSLSRNFMRRSVAATVRLWADTAPPWTTATELTGSPPFVLVHNPSRLPLHLGDGQPVTVALAQEGAPEATNRLQPSTLIAGDDAETWKANLAFAAGSGYIRLFAAVKPEVASRLAVLDPPVSRLRLG